LRYSWHFRGIRWQSAQTAALNYQIEASTCGISPGQEIRPHRDAGRRRPNQVNLIQHQRRSEGSDRKQVDDWGKTRPATAPNGSRGRKGEGTVELSRRASKSSICAIPLARYHHYEIASGLPDRHRCWRRRR